MSKLCIQYDKNAPSHFALKGQLVHETCMKLVDKLKLDALIHSFVLNIQQVDELDGSGVGVLVTLAICLEHQHKELVIIVDMDSQPGKMLKYLGILKLLGVKK